MAQDGKNKNYAGAPARAPAAEAAAPAAEPAAKPVEPRRAAAVSRPAPVKDPALVYVGPPMTGALLLGRFQAFRNGLPAAITARMESDAAFKRLFVPAKELALACKKLSERGSRLACSYQAVVNSLKGGK